MPDVAPADLTWSSSDSVADAVLAERVVALAGPGEVALGRLCPSCASSDHGRPWLRHDGQDVAVSVSRSGPHLLTVVALQHGAVGVDVEEIARVRRHPIDEVLADGETAVSADELARIWVAKESILKAHGTGLAQPMSALKIADYRGRLRWLPAPDGFVAALALGGERR